MSDDDDDYVVRDDDDDDDDDDVDIDALDRKALCGIRMPEVNFCCFCFPLKTGCIIIGVLLTIFGILELIHYYHPDAIIDRSADEHDDEGPEYYQQRIANTQKFRHLALGSAGVSLGVLLLYGTLAEALWALALWLWLYSALLIAVLVTAIPFAVRQGGKSVVGGVLEFFFAFLFFLIGLYFLVVVYSFYTVVRFVEDITHSQYANFLPFFGRG